MKLTSIKILNEINWRQDCQINSSLNFMLVAWIKQKHSGQAKIFCIKLQVTLEDLSSFFLWFIFVLFSAPKPPIYFYIGIHVATLPNYFSTEHCKIIFWAHQAFWPKAKANKTLFGPIKPTNPPVRRAYKGQSSFWKPVVLACISQSCRSNVPAVFCLLKQYTESLSPYTWLYWHVG